MDKMEENLINMNCNFLVKNWKYGGFYPCEIIKKWDSKVIKVRQYIINPKDGSIIETIETGDFIPHLLNSEYKKGDIIDMFYPGVMISTNGYELIVDQALRIPGGFKIYYKYIQCSEEKLEELREKNPYWCFINNLGYQVKKIVPGYNFISISDEDEVDVLDTMSLEKLKENRLKWYLEDNTDRDTIIYFEKLLGYQRQEDGLGWMEYFFINAPKGIGLKRTHWVDMRDEKNPKYSSWVEVSGKNLTIKEGHSIEEIISDAVEKNKEGN